MRAPGSKGKSSSPVFLTWMPAFRIANLTLIHVALERRKGLVAWRVGDVFRLYTNLTEKDERRRAWLLFSCFSKNLLGVFQSLSDLHGKGMSH